MRPSFIIALAVLVVVGLVTWLGLVGLTTRKIITVGSCRGAYTHYYVQPFWRNAWECSNRTPCGTDEPLDRRNAGAEVIQCLCRQQPRPNTSITRVYQEIVQPVDPITNRSETSSAIPAEDTTQLCQFASPALRI